MVDNEKVVSVTKLEADEGDDEELEDETGTEPLGESVVDRDDALQEVVEPEVDSEE